MIKYLHEDETVQKAIQRLKPKSKLVKNKNQKEKKETSQNDSSNKQEFDNLLDIVSKLLELSHFDVYSDCLEKIIKKYGRNEILIWKYRTISKNKEIQVYESFKTSEIIEWINQVILL